MNVIRKLLLQEAESQEQLLPAVKKYFVGKVFKHTYEELNAKRRPYSTTDYTVYFRVEEVITWDDDRIGIIYHYLDQKGNQITTVRQMAARYGFIMSKLYKGRIAVKEYIRFGGDRIFEDKVKHIMKTYFNYDLYVNCSCRIDGMH